MPSADLSAPIYAALTGNSDITAALATYEGAPAIFTRRPVPPDTPFPMIISAGDVTRGDEDMVSDAVPVIIRDISVFGQNDTAAHYRAVEALGLMVRDLFHRKRSSLAVAGWSVLDVVCSGPVVGPTDDDTTVHRLVTLTVRLS